MSTENVEQFDHCIRKNVDILDMSKVRSSHPKAAKTRSVAAQRRGARIRELRKAAKLTQDQLAAEVGVARSTITGAETGAAMIGRGTLEALATLFKVSVDFLIISDDDLKPPKPCNVSEDLRELDLVRHWRQLTESSQDAAFAVVSNLPKRTP